MGFSFMNFSMASSVRGACLRLLAERHVVVVLALFLVRVLDVLDEQRQALIRVGERVGLDGFVFLLGDGQTVHGVANGLLELPQFGVHIVLLDLSGVAQPRKRRQQAITLGRNGGHGILRPVGLHIGDIFLDDVHSGLAVENRIQYRTAALVAGIRSKRQPVAFPGYVEIVVVRMGREDTNLHQFTVLKRQELGVAVVQHRVVFVDASLEFF